MIEKVRYVCETCGQEFLTEEECLAHERQENAKGFKDRVMFFDENNEPIGHAPSRSGVANSYAVWTADDEALDFVNDYLQDSGYNPIYVNDLDLQDGANTFYIAADGEWHSLEADMETLKEIQKKVKKVVDK